MGEDIDEWKATLTPEERDLVDRQAAGEYDKAFRKSDDFNKDIPEDKIASFGRVMQKFFEAEWKDAKEEQIRKERDVPTSVFLRPLPPVVRARAPEGVARDRVAARGLAEDIDEWKATLTPEERDLVDRQAAGEYDKAFRKSDDFNKDIPEDKI